MPPMYGPGGAWSDNSGLGDQIGGALNKLGLNGPTPGDQRKQNHLNYVGKHAVGFGDTARDNYGMMTDRLGGSLDALNARANGQNSVSALQLHQALQQNLANQQAMAAAANPASGAMAARTGAMQMGRLGMGLAGQQALAGLQERNQAQDAYAQLLSQARGQDVQGAIGGYNAATGAYGGGLNGQRDPTLAGGVSGLLGAIR